MKNLGKQLFEVLVKELENYSFIYFEAEEVEKVVGSYKFKQFEIEASNSKIDLIIEIVGTSVSVIVNNVGEDYLLTSTNMEEITRQILHKIR